MPNRLPESDRQSDWCWLSWLLVGKRWHAARTRVGCGLAAACLLVAERSQGQPASTLPSLQLDWPSIEGCPSPDEVRLAIASHLGEAKGQSNAVVATAIVEHKTGYHLFLYTRSGAAAGTRELTGDTCRGVADAAVVILAMMLGADSVAPAVEVHADAGESVPQRRWPAIEARAVPSRVMLTAREFRLSATTTLGFLAPRIGIGAWVPIGSMRTPRLGVTANAVADLSGWRLSAQVGWVPEQKVGLVGDTGRGAWVTLLSAAVSVGPALRHGQWEFVPRIGISEQILRGTGFGVDFPEPRSVYFASARLGVLLQLRLMSQVYVQSTLDLSVPFRRPSILLDPGGEVLRPARLGFDAGLLLALRF